jgi:hypothetical protein
MGSDINKQETLTQKEVTGLIRTAWLKKIMYAAVQADPLVPKLDSAIVGTIDPGKKDDKGRVHSIPGKVVQNIEINSETKVARNIILQKTLPLAGDGYEGLADAPGNEENVDLRYANIYANDIGHAVPYQQYGITSREAIPVQVTQDLQQLLGTWRGEKEGYDMRSAVINRISQNLKAAPHSLTEALNPNWYVVGLPDSSQPVYDPTKTTYEAAVRAAMNDVSLTAPGDSALDISSLIKVSSVLKQRYITPFMFEGHMLWALYVHDDVADALNDPAVTASYGAYIKDVAAFSKADVRSIIPNASWIINERLVVVRDCRCPVIGVEAGTTTPAYMKMGRNDERGSVAAATRIFYCNYVLGANALVRFNPEPWAFHNESQDYGKNKGISYDTGLSFQIPLYDKDSAQQDATSLLSEGSMVVATAKKI